MKEIRSYLYFGIRGVSSRGLLDISKNQTVAQVKIWVIWPWLAPCSFWKDKWTWQKQAGSFRAICWHLGACWATSFKATCLISFDCISEAAAIADSQFYSTFSQNYPFCCPVIHIHVMRPLRLRYPGCKKTHVHLWNPNSIQIPVVSQSWQILKLEELMQQIALQPALLMSFLQQNSRNSTASKTSDPTFPNGGPLTATNLSS